MKRELLIFGLTAFFIANTYYDGKYVTILKSWKKYYQMIMIGFIGLSAYLFMKKYPSHSRSLFTHANSIIKYMPIDKGTSSILSPILDFTSRQDYNRSQGMYGGSVPVLPVQSRIETSGLGKPGERVKRSVSDSKKRFVASRQGWKCGHCGETLNSFYQVDHKIRLDQGGSNHIDNLMALCAGCHSIKTGMENLSL